MHWYDSEGRACHTVIGTNGKERATTLRDARKLVLYPSVTSILAIQDKINLTRWLINELVSWCIDNPYHPHDYINTSVYVKRAFIGMRSKGKLASERGTEIHNKLEDYYKTGRICPIDADYITPAIELIGKEFGSRDWKSETTFCNQKHGYAGSVDLHCSDIVIDFKTKDKTDIKDMVQYIDHKMQLAAYQEGLELKANTRRFNLFISINPETPGKCVLRECTEYDKYIDMFKLLSNFWHLKNNLYPTSKECID